MVKLRYLSPNGRRGFDTSARTDGEASIPSARTDGEASIPSARTDGEASIPRPERMVRLRYLSPNGW